jgi:hypothetical protein
MQPEADRPAERFAYHPAGMAAQVCFVVGARPDFMKADEPAYAATGLR